MSTLTATSLRQAVAAAGRGAAPYLLPGNPLLTPDFTYVTPIPPSQTAAAAAGGGRGAAAGGAHLRQPPRRAAAAGIRPCASRHPQGLPAQNNAIPIVDSTLKKPQIATRTAQPLFHLPCSAVQQGVRNCCLSFAVQQHYLWHRIVPSPGISLRVKLSGR